VQDTPLVHYTMVVDELVSQVSQFPSNMILLPAFTMYKFDDDGIHFSVLEVRVNVVYYVELKVLRDPATLEFL
jgi:hypothetical protein